MTPITPIVPTQTVGSVVFGPSPGVHNNALPPPPPVTIIHGTRLVIGIQNPKRIDNLPPDLIRLKLRFRKFTAKAFVFTPGIVEEWLLRDNGDTWSLAIRTGRNQHVPRT